METIFCPKKKQHIVIHRKFLSDDESQHLLQQCIIKNDVNNKKMTKKGIPTKKRIKTIYGSIDDYVIRYRGETIHTKVNSWSTFSELESIGQRIEELTGQIYNTCVTQIYCSGDVEIKPHRDKEMKKDSIIASISIGESRTMKFERTGFTPLEILLENGDLCLIYSPTNDYWLHSIPKDNSTIVRISCIYRNFSP